MRQTSLPDSHGRCIACDPATIEVERIRVEADRIRQEEDRLSRQAHFDAWANARAQFAEWVGDEVRAGRLRALPTIIDRGRKSAQGHTDPYLGRLREESLVIVASYLKPQALAVDPPAERLLTGACVRVRRRFVGELKTSQLTDLSDPKASFRRDHETVPLTDPTHWDLDRDFRDYLPLAGIDPKTLAQ
jgi:hypothetical protein